MYVLLVAVVTVRARGLWGKKSVLEAEMTVNSVTISPTPRGW